MGRYINKNSPQNAVLAANLVNYIPKWEYHVHTNYTDGKNTPLEMVEAAIKQGLTRMIFTEHTEPWMVQSENWFEDYFKEIDSLKNKFKNKIEILMGLEVPAMDFETGLGLTDEMDEKADFLLGAAHRYPEMPDKKTRDLTHEEAIDFEYRTLMALANNQRIDSIAHIGATCQKYCGSFPLDLMREVIRKATTNYIAIEVNTEYHNPLKDFLDICIEENAYITLGSNAHKAKNVGQVYHSLIKATETT